MSCFSTVSSVVANSKLDLTKHVNYTAGMILGVDDFTQEFAYLAGRDRWLARDALGYGTVSGLSIQIEEDSGKNDIRVMVNAGVAINPRGQFICVPTPQCAYLNEWLAAADAEKMNEHVKRGENASPPSSPPAGDELTLYIVLCYRDCPTDKVPIPGEPCRNDDQLTAPSRLKDDFSLELRFESPKHSEEKAVREFVEWLKQITIIETGTSTPVADFLQAIRDEWLNPASPPVISSPAPALEINANDFCDYMRAAFRLWVTELRNELSERKTGCCGEMTAGDSLEGCVLLAELKVPLTAVSPSWRVSETEEVEIIEENRPFLLHLRMLQEWMLCGCRCAGETVPPIVSPLIPLSPMIPLSPPPTSPTVTSPVVNSPTINSPVINSPTISSPDIVTSPQIPPPPPPHEHTLDNLTDVTVPDPKEGQHLVYRGTEWIAEDQTVIEFPDIKFDDLTDVTVPNPKDGQTLIYKNGEWVAETPEKIPVPQFALDDLTDVTVNLPKEGQILIFRGGQWVSDAQAAIIHGSLGGLKEDDHKIYLLADGSRALTGNLLGGNKKIVNLAPGTAAGDAVVFQQAIKDGDNAGGDLTGTYPKPTIAKLQGKTLDANPTEGQILIFRNNKWVAETFTPSGGGVTDHGALTGLGDDDHKQYLLIDGTRAMTGNLNLGNKQITNLTAATANNQAVIFQQAIKDGDNAGGDLTGTYPKPTINLLQGKPVKASTPNINDRLTWNGTAWVPLPVDIPEPTPTGIKELILPLATVTRTTPPNTTTQTPTYEIWFNIDAPGNLARVSGFKEGHLQILDETDSPTRFTQPIKYSLKPSGTTRNVFNVTLLLEPNQLEPDRMRFNFDVNEIVVEVNSNNPADTAPLIEYARKNDTVFVGYKPDGKFITVFVRGLVRLG